MHVFSVCSTSNIIHRKSVCTSECRCWNPPRKSISCSRCILGGRTGSLPFAAASRFACYCWFCNCTLTLRKQWNGSQPPHLSSSLSKLLGESTQSSIGFLTHYFPGSCCKMTSIVWQIISFFDISAAVIVPFCHFLFFFGRQVFQVFFYFNFFQGDAGSSAAGIKVGSKHWNSVGFFFHKQTVSRLVVRR